MRYLKVVQLILYRIVLSNYSFRTFKTRLCNIKVKGSCAILRIYYKRRVSIMINNYEKIIIKVKFFSELNGF